MTHEYAFDVKLFAAIRVRAPDEKTARAMLRAEIDGNEADLGLWPDGSSITAEVSMDDGDGDDLYEIDGEFVD